MKRLTSADVKQDIILKAIARGVGIYSPHTACDNCENGGTSYCLIYTWIHHLHIY